MNTKALVAVIAFVAGSFCDGAVQGRRRPSGFRQAECHRAFSLTGATPTLAFKARAGSTARLEATPRESVRRARRGAQQSCRSRIDCLFRSRATWPCSRPRPGGDRLRCGRRQQTEDDLPAAPATERAGHRPAFFMAAPLQAGPMICAPWPESPRRPPTLTRGSAMALMDFIKKQFIDIIEWTEAGDGTLAWRFPMADREIQNGASLTVRESQMAVFVNEGKVADVFGPGRYNLTTADAADPDLPAELGQAVQEPVQERRLLLQHAPAGRPALGHHPAGDDPRQGLRRGAAARLRQLRLPGRRPEAVPHRNLRHARHLHRGRARRPAARADAAAHLGCGGVSSGIAFLDLAANQIEFANQLQQATVAGLREDRAQARRRDGAERVAARRVAEDPRPEDRHGHGRRGHGQVHAVPDRAGDPEVRRGRRRWRWCCRRCHGPGCRRGARPGDGAAAAAGAAGRRAAGSRGPGPVRV